MAAGKEPTSKVSTKNNEEVVKSVMHSFYVDNCLQSLQSQDQARNLIDKLRSVLVSGGFEIRQWASNMPDGISHIPTEAKSAECQLWLNANKTDPQESALGLLWCCSTDTLGYKHRSIPSAEPTLRYVYRVLASQYDPLGYIIPFTTRAKVIVQALWKKESGWDAPLPYKLLPVWQAWERELPNLQKISLPRCYTYDVLDTTPAELHDRGRVHVSFVMARSRVAPKKQLSIPRLELCAALTGAQLAKLQHTEMTLSIHKTILLSDSTTVLHWIQSDSQHYKVFVGTRIAEIQELVGTDSWRYVPSEENPADDITRGKHLLDLAKPNRWTSGPTFLQLPLTGQLTPWLVLHTQRRRATPLSAATLLQLSLRLQI